MTGSGAASGRRRSRWSCSGGLQPRVGVVRGLRLAWRPEIAPSVEGASASTGGGALSEVRSGTSLMKRMAIRARSAVAAAIQEHVADAVAVRALDDRAHRGGERGDHGNGAVAHGAVDAQPGQAVLVYCMIRLPRTAPSAETPIAPPSVRKNVTTSWPRPAHLASPGSGRTGRGSAWSCRRPRPWRTCRSPGASTGCRTPACRPEAPGRR